MMQVIFIHKEFIFIYENFTASSVGKLIKVCVENIFGDEFNHKIRL